MSEQTTSKKIEACRLTGSELLPVFDLGSPCVSDFLPVGEAGIPAPLCVAVAKETPSLAQLTHSYPPEAMYRRYHYRSGTNEAMRQELADVVAKARRLRPVEAGEAVLDIACNDGTLLENWCSEYGTSPFYLVGVDPSDVAREAFAFNGRSYWLISDFFSAAAYRSNTDKPAAVVTCVAMFYDLDDPIGFLKDVRSVMADDGLFVLQVAYIPMHLRMGAWDYIGHEHLTAWDFRSLAYALERAGLSIVDAEITCSNGGSIRVYATPAENFKRLSETVEGMAGATRRALISWHETADTHGIGAPAYGWQSVEEAWRALGEKARRDRAALLTFLRLAEARGKRVVGYGASTKGNSILQFCGIGPDLLPCIAERQQHKIGLVTAGSSIPIISESEMRAMKPDYLLCLPWFFVDAFRQREAQLIAGGTRLVVPLPKLTVFT